MQFPSMSSLRWTHFRTQKFDNLNYEIFATYLSFLKTYLSFHLYEEIASNLVRGFSVVQNSIPLPNICYNVPRACLLNRSPISAMVIKSNRSGLLCSKKQWMRLVTSHHRNLSSAEMIMSQTFKQCRATS